LKTFKHSFVVDAPIGKVWDFYTDLYHLEIITPKEIGFKIIESDCDKITQGQTVHLSGKLLTKITWKSKIIFCKPYTYVDEMSEKGCSNIGSILMIFIKSSKIRPESQMRSSLNYLVVYWKTVRTICSR
jgi:uncharacterized membrane protein